MAISKERLEELIEQGATIWTNDFEEIKLDKNTCEVCEVKTLSGEHLYWVFDFEYEFNNVKHNAKFDLDELEEDFEKCKWQREFGCIERVERLELPTWEEFLKSNTGIHFYKNSYEYGLHKVKYSADNIKPDIRIEIYVYYNDLEESSDYLFCEPLTKENYLLACRKAKELFLKGDKENG